MPSARFGGTGPWMSQGVPMMDHVRFPASEFTMSIHSQDPPLVIDCHCCELYGSDACTDCVVTYICRVDSASPVVVDLAEARAIRLLDDAGLVPPLRHRRASG